MCHGDLSHSAGGSGAATGLAHSQGEGATAEREATGTADITPIDAVSLLREIRDAAARHYQYVEVRDRAQNEYLAAEAERARRFERLQRRGQVIWLLVVVALYLIVVAQFRR